MTVAWYQGPNAEQAWLRDISIHLWLRHPNFVQLYGVASTGTMHAAVFHDDLVPFKQFVDIHCNSPILSRYFRAHWLWKSTKPVAATNSSATEGELSSMGMRLDAHCGYGAQIAGWREGIDIMSYNGPNHEAMAISSLSLSHTTNSVPAIHPIGQASPSPYTQQLLSDWWSSTIP
ncbi:hypothetical protein B0H11DRAFT_1928980 [Mycena galericulata]|nr:hypothetical protein B0H11DRAFT_1928980 [Mycena galericulata]